MLESGQSFIRQAGGMDMRFVVKSISSMFANQLEENSANFAINTAHVKIC